MEILSPFSKRSKSKISIKILYVELKVKEFDQSQAYDSFVLTSSPKE
jgi:hypothetical protein